LDAIDQVGLIVALGALEERLPTFGGELFLRERRLQKRDHVLLRQRVLQVGLQSAFSDREQSGEGEVADVLELGDVVGVPHEEIGLHAIAVALLVLEDPLGERFGLARGGVGLRVLFDAVAIAIADQADAGFFDRACVDADEEVRIDEGRLPVADLEERAVGWAPFDGVAVLADDHRRVFGCAGPTETAVHHLVHQRRFGIDEDVDVRAHAGAPFHDAAHQVERVIAGLSADAPHGLDRFLQLPAEIAQPFDYGIVFVGFLDFAGRFRLPARHELSPVERVHLFVGDRGGDRLVRQPVEEVAGEVVAEQRIIGTFEPFHR
jgi:hypothetical protein